MQRGHDERAKLIAERTLDLLGEIRREVEVPTCDAQRMDLRFQRLYHQAQVPAYLAVLDRLFVEDCIIEVFSQAFSLEDFWESLRKQYGWRRHLQDQALERSEERPAGPVPPSQMWLISAGRPERVMAEYRLAPRKGCLSGVYDLEGGSFRISLIVIGELPLGKGTLLLRLMGSAAVRKGALAELRGLPEGDPDGPALRRIATDRGGVAAHDAACYNCGRG